MPSQTPDNPSDRIRQRLSAIQQAMADIRELVVLDSEGTVIASTLSGEINTGPFTAGPTMIDMANDLLAALDGGELFQLFVRGGNGFVVITEFGPKAVLITLTTNTVKLIQMLMDLKRLGMSWGIFCSIEAV